MNSVTSCVGWFLLLSFMCRSMSQTCPSHRGGYTSQSPLQSSQTLGIYLNNSPDDVIPCDGTVYAWHYCYYSSISSEGGSGSPNAVFGAYYFDGPSGHYRMRPGSYYPLYLNSRENTFTCGTVTLNESQHFQVQQGDIVGACLSEIPADQTHQIDVVASRSSGSAIRWSSVSQGCLENDIAVSDENLLQNTPYTIHLFVDINVDECAVDEDNCHRSRGICSDIVGSSGSFQCSCIPGYTGDGVTSCRNTDECSEQLDSCDVNANCVDTFGSYVCLCRAGFKSYGPVVGEICVNVDECATTAATCVPNADCVDTFGSYECVCRPGYSGDGIFTCTAIEECLTCPANADCIQNGSSYNCVCRVGYTVNEDSSCTDINECLKTESPCDVNAKCVNTAGSYSCLCKSGYIGNGKSCRNVDECEEDFVTCVANSQCVDTEGSYTCTCYPEYTGNGFIDCQLQSNTSNCSEVCDINAFCTHVDEGRPKCVCKVGYTGDGHSCINTSNCSDVCDINAFCTHVDDRLKCVCKVGYTGDGYSCIMSTSTASANNDELIPGLIGSFVILITLFIVASLLIIICYKYKRVRSLHLPGRKNRTTNNSIGHREEPSPGQTFSNSDCYDRLQPGQSVTYPPYDYLSSQIYSEQGYPDSRPAYRGSTEQSYCTIEDTATHCESSTSNALEFYHVLTQEHSASNRDTVMYCIPATEERILHSQIISYGVNDLLNTDIVLMEPLGSGQFGSVSKGLWTSGSGVLEVAVKTLTDAANTVKFLQEAAIMAQFRHPNVILLYGIVSAAQPKMIVAELMHNGDLKAFLKTLRPDPGEMVPSDVPQHLLEFCQQIAIGMNYLSTKGFVHRDLAARNVLVSKHNICKIADFGMSRDLLDEDYYVAHVEKIPVKWCAPEVLKYRKYSSASDVWSYGCVLYEIWSLGHTPYKDATNSEAIELIMSGNRLPPPPGCPKAIYVLMSQCWNMIASERPDYKTMLRVLISNKEAVLSIPHEEITKDHGQAGVLGAPLEVGRFLYTSLQDSHNSS